LPFNDKPSIIAFFRAAEGAAVVVPTFIDCKNRKMKYNIRIKNKLENLIRLYNIYTNDKTLYKITFFLYDTN
jgi:hypothetical protein